MVLVWYYGGDRAARAPHRAAPLGGIGNIDKGDVQIMLSGQPLP